MFLLRPSLRRLLGRLRSSPVETVLLDDLDRDVINMTYGACKAITQLSKYMTRTVSHKSTLGTNVELTDAAPPPIRSIMVDLGSDFLCGRVHGRSGYLVWLTLGHCVRQLGLPGTM